MRRSQGDRKGRPGWPRQSQYWRVADTPGHLMVGATLAVALLVVGWNVFALLVVGWNVVALAPALYT